MMSPDQARRLAKLDLLSVGFSIDGNRDLHDAIRGVPGTFDRLVHNVQAFREQRQQNGKSNPVINFKTVISPDNAGRLLDIYKLAQESGADYLTFQIENQSLDLSALQLKENFHSYSRPPQPFKNFDAARLRANLEELSHLNGAHHPKVRFIPEFSIPEVYYYYTNQLDVKEYSCDAIWTGMNISPYGDVFPCFNYHIGNIRQLSLVEAWNHARFRGFRQKVRQGLFASCMGCCDLEGNPRYTEDICKEYRACPVVATD